MGEIKVPEDVLLAGEPSWRAGIDGVLEALQIDECGEQGRQQAERLLEGLLDAGLAKHEF